MSESCRPNCCGTSNGEGRCFGCGIPLADCQAGKCGFEMSFSEDEGEREAYRRLRQSLNEEPSRR